MLKDNFVISSSSESVGSGNAGDIDIETYETFYCENGKITTISNYSDGGNIDIQTGKLLLFNNAEISSAVKGGNDTIGGNITVQSVFSVLNKTQIIANAYEGTGGNISIASDQLFRSSDSIIDASSKLGISGNISIQSPESDLTGKLNALPSTFMDATHWLSTPCEHRGDNVSSILISERDSLPQLPDDLLTVPPFLLMSEPSFQEKITPLILKGLQQTVISHIQSEMADQYLPENDILANIILVTSYMDLGFNNKAQTILSRIPKKIETNDSIKLKALFHNTQGDLALLLNKPLDSIKIDFTKGLQYAKLTNDALLIAATLNHLGNYYAVAGLSTNSYDFAWKQYSEALSYLNDHNTNHLIARAVILINLAQISLNRYSSFDQIKIENAIFQAENVVQQLNDHYYKGFYLLSLYQLNHLYMTQYPDNTDQVFTQNHRILNQLLSIVKALDNSQLLSYAYGYCGHFLHCQNKIEQAIQYSKKAIFIAQQYAIPELHYRWKWQLSKLLAQNGQIELAQKTYQGAIDIVKPISRQFFNAGRFKSDLFKEFIQPVYMELVNLNIQHLLNDSEILSNILPIIEQAKIAELQNFYKDECIKEKNNKTISTFIKTKTFQKNSVIIYPLLTDPIQIIVLFEDGPKLISTQAELSQIKTLARSFNKRLNQASKESRIRYLGDKLYQTFIQPIKPFLADQTQTLIFVPDGVLRLIPYAALYDSGSQQYLCETYAVVTLPALSLSQQQSASQKPTLLLGGLSSKRNGFSELPNVKKELESIHHIMGGKILQEKTFTKDHIQNELDYMPYNILHFCTHGTFGNNPESIQLNTYGKPIKLNELNELIARCNYRKHPIDLLTISACDTALGDERAILGLGGIAVKTGVKSAIASLWKVEDEAASKMMAFFYASLKNKNGQKAQSLRDAQIKMIKSKQFSHPSYWAPFVLIGEWL